MPEENQNKSSLKKIWTPAIVGGLIGASLVGGVGYASGAFNQVTSQDEVEEIVHKELAKKDQGQASKASGTQEEASVNITTDVSAIVDKVKGSVVSVVNLADTSNSELYDLFGFKNPGSQSAQTPEEQYTTASEGSGVIYKVEGDRAYIVTNNHVIDGQDAIEIITSEGEQVPAKLVGADKFTDLAVLSIPAEYAHTVAQFGDSRALSVGEPAIAIGSPLGSDFASTVTYGIISGLDRQVPVDLDQDGSADWQVNAIQTDAAINPGNSGGALVNSAGQLIGINSMKISTANVEGMGFAIPSHEVQKIIAQLEENGKVIRPKFGVQMTDLRRIPLDQQENLLKLPKEVENGVVIMDVISNTPASKAGLKPYDVITKFNGEAVNSTVELRQKLYSTDPTATVTVEVYREGRPVEVKVQLEAQSSNETPS
ncbi:S1C family serine protease [Aerococcus sanguinicola]|uniref:PDZ domain-containing protein n=1 Tax=Aerococcus sanguinicola TaxID=119206 RepID=A0A0X8FD57_9LACT|nr:MULTISPECIES: trypsin-like peptidase domain-containing protein [Aerococcus]AMB94342.1 serine protease [Aerococcus sanguinicola]MDK7049872.1 trypsin-like peptidase domain-containing protein [Aerococcus sanguinicola]OFT92852.1 serine protease [Aerococcus sp. HMSC23C02]PKZ22521.1 PDZ domain-containing protein [Aerococcus sanguinicola]